MSRIEWNQLQMSGIQKNVLPCGKATYEAKEAEINAKLANRQIAEPKRRYRAVE